MPTTLTRFELAILDADYVAHPDAVTQFITSITSLAAQIYYRTEARIMFIDDNGSPVPENVTIYTGYFNASQSGNALTILQTYNAAIGHNTPCDTVQVSIQP